MIKRNIAKAFKDFFSNLAESLLTKLFNAPNKHNLKSSLQYYSKFVIEEPSHLSDTSREEVFESMQNIKILKAAGVGNLSGKFSKDAAEILGKHISEVYNLPVTSRTFRNACKVEKLKPIFKKEKNADSSNCRPISLSPLISKILESFIHG